MVIFDFNSENGARGWQVVDDVVMGGRSDGSVGVDDEGHGIFEGIVSLENNGGFSSIRCLTGSIDAGSNSSFVITLKGDGKNYQFRVKRSLSDRHSYTYTFSTTGEWQRVTVPFAEMTPTFRGYTPEIPNYQGDKMQEIGFLISNKKAEKFRLLVDLVELQ